MHPGAWSQLTPNKRAVAMADGTAFITYEELDRRSRRLARFFSAAGLTVGDHVAVLADNRIEFLEACWAAQRTGLYYTPVNTRLAPEEAAYIVNDCNARVLVASGGVRELASSLLDLTPGVDRRLVVGGALVGHEEYESKIADLS